MTPPTPQMAETLAAIRRLTVDGISPTLRELQVELGLANVSGVHRALSRLKQRGLVSWEPNLSRSLQIVDQAPNYDAMPTSELLAISRQVEAVLANRGTV